MTATRPPARPRIGEADLLAYVDRRLDAERRAEVEAHLATTPEDAERIAADLAIQMGLRLLFGYPLAGPGPRQTQPTPRRRGSWLRRTTLSVLLAAGVP